jgi:ribA/ribD-fused uncharacterized protein
MYPDSSKNLNYGTDDAVYWFSTPYEPLNNWSAHVVKIWGKTFPTVEHGYHWRKFSETASGIAEEILAAPSPWAAMQIERQHKGKRRKDWEEVKVGIMTELIRAKAAQNEDVREMLLKTGTKRIVENSPWDDFWGIGPNGDGQNQVGKILMQVRDELK